VMAERRLVILSEPAEARGNAGKELCDSLVEVVAELREQAQTVLLVVTAAKADKRSAWVKAFKEPAAVVDCAPPKAGKALTAFVRAEAKRQGVSLERGVAARGHRRDRGATGAIGEPFEAIGRHDSGNLGPADLRLRSRNLRREPDARGPQ